MVDELGLTELIDAVIKQDHEQRYVSVGLCVKAMILNGLGFVNRALYLMPHFFKDKPVERLLGEGITFEQLNDDALGRALDAIYAYGPEQLTGNWRRSRSSVWDYPAPSATWTAPAFMSMASTTATRKRCRKALSTSRKA